MPLVEAVKRGYIKGTSDEIRDAITSHYEKMKLASLKTAIMEYSTTKVCGSYLFTTPKHYQERSLLSS